MKDYLGISGKAAIVTGSGRGIGQGVAEALAEYPAYYEEQNGEALDQELYNIMAAPADVLDRCELYVNLPQETLKYYDKLWTQLGV